MEAARVTAFRANALSSFIVNSGNRLGSRLRHGLCVLACLCLAPLAVTAQESNPAQEIVERAAVAMRTDPEASRRDVEEALEMLRRRPDADIEIRARLILCDYQSERDTAAAEEQIRLIGGLMFQSRRPGLRAGMFDCQGQIAETAGNNDKALENYESAVAIASAAEDEEMLAAALFSRGYLLGLQGQYAAGLADLRHAQGIYEDLDLPQHAMTALNGIAILYNRMGDYEQAQHMYSLALKAQRDAKLLREQAVTLHNLGRAQENLSQWDRARESFQDSLELCRKLGYSRGEAYALRGLAAVDNGLGNPKAALETLQRAEEIQRETPDARLAAQINLARGIALHQLKRLPEAVTALEDALQVFRQAASLSELRATYEELATTHSEMGNWRAAFGFLDRAGEVTERKYLNQIDQRFATLKIEFDTASKEKENALLMRENQANEKALEQERRARALQAAVIVLVVVLAAVLLVLALHQRRMSMRMRSLAMTDELTGVPNRRAVLGKLAEVLSQRGASACSLLIIDIDHFKSINDQHGHPEGDAALKLVAAMVRDTVGASGVVGRLGGEEFAAVLPGTDNTTACDIAERIRCRVMSIDSLSWLGERRITVSIGVTTSTPSSNTVADLLHHADGALYEAKRSGRNCLKVQPSPVNADPAPTKAPAGSGAQVGFA